MAGRILKEPPLQHAFFLLENLQDAPEAGKGGGAKNCGRDFMIHEYRSGGEKASPATSRIHQLPLPQ